MIDDEYDAKKIDGISKSHHIVFSNHISFFDSSVNGKYLFSIDVNDNNQKFDNSNNI